MDWDLWESSYNQDTVVSDYVQCGWKFDFFGHRYDVIEENALNEKSCLQVLRKLIAKADEDIVELEQSLVSLQTELAYTELQEWPEICCNALREKINGLDDSVRRLRKESENVSDHQVLMPMEKAENIEDVLKSLLTKHFLQRDKQQPPELIDVVVKSDTSADAKEHSEGMEQRQLEYDITVKEELGETKTMVETCSRMNSSSSDHLEKKPNHPEPVVAMPTPTYTMAPCSVASILVGASPDEKEKMVMEKEPISKDEKVVECDSLEPEGNRSFDAVELIVKAPSSTSFKFSDECVSVVKNLCRSDLKVSRSMEVNMSSTKEDSAATKVVHLENDQACDRIEKQPWNDTVEEHTSLATFIETAAANARNPITKSKSSISRPAEGGDRDLDKKIAELKRKKFRKECIGGKKIGKNTVEEERLTGLEVESQKRSAVFYKSNVTLGQKPQILTTEGKFQSDSQKAEPVAGKPKIDETHGGIVVIKNSHLNFTHKLQSPRPKMNSQPDSKIKGHCALPTKRKHNSSSQTLKSDTSKDNAQSKDALDRNSKKLALPDSFATDRVSSLAIVVHPLVQPLADVEFPGPLGGNNNPNALAVVPLLSDTSDLRHMKVPELRVFAKEINVGGGCSKLKKSELIEKIKAKQEEMSQI